MIQIESLGSIGDLTHEALKNEYEKMLEEYKNTSDLDKTTGSGRLLKSKLDYLKGYLNDLSEGTGKPLSI